MANENRNVFVIEDGTKCISFNNQYGQEIGKIHIRSGDISILDRYDDLLKDFEKIVEPLQHVELKNDGTSSFDKDWEIIKGVEKELINRINAVFDMEDGANLFTNRNAFSTINGHFYVENVIKALGDVVSQEIAHESEITQKRISKYTKDISK